MEAYFKLGCNFDFELINKVQELNDKYKQNSKIIEFYGSVKEDAYISARPDFRLKDVSRKELEKFVQLALDNNIIFNYTVNTIYFGSKRELLSKENRIKNLIKYLEDIGVARVTVANPIILNIIKEASEKINIEISTIAHVDTITQIKYYKDNYNVDKICGNLLKNRNVKFLKNAIKYCNKNNIVYEIMVNEFCGIGGYEYATHCIYRDSCYLCHATNKTEEDNLLYNGYPMKYCMSSRNNYPPNWLRMRWIRPQDINRYINEIGINHFKITGRTGTTEYLYNVAKGYMSRKWDKNLLELWKPLETIISKQNELDFIYPVEIPAGLLDGYLDKWFNDENFDCANEVCGETCRYCHDYWDKKIRKNIK